MKKFLLWIAIKIFKKYDILIFNEIDHRIDNNLHFYDVEVDLGKMKNNITGCINIMPQGATIFRNRYLK